MFARPSAKLLTAISAESCVVLSIVLRVNPTEFKTEATGEELPPFMQGQEVQDQEVQDQESPAIKKNGMISSVLSPAVRFWLRSQLDHVEDLQFTVEAGDRQLLAGGINRVVVSASKAVYQGLHLSQVSVTAEKIRTNLRQVLRGKPLRLLEAFPVVGSVVLSEADLNDSLRSPLLTSGIAEFLLILFNAGLTEENRLSDTRAKDVRLQDPQILLETDRLTLAATLLSDAVTPTSIILRTGFRLENGNQLRLDRPHRLTHIGEEPGTYLDRLDGYTFDLGSSVCFNHLSLEPGQLSCNGQVTVTP